MLQQVQVLIIGGGAVGASTLYHLAKAGVSNTLLIEKSELTSGSTWHAAGNIPIYANSWGGMRAGNYAWHMYKDLAKEVDYPITYRHTGAFWPAHSKERMELFHHLQGMSRGLGYDMAMVTPSEMDAMHPYFNSGKSIIGGIYDPYEGDVDPSQLTQALVKGARDLGATVERFTEVEAIERRSSGEWLVRTTKGEVLCDVVVNASGYYGRQVGAMVGQPLPVVTLEHQYLVTSDLPELEANPENFPLVRDPDIMYYLRRERNALLLGSYGHAGRPAWLDGMPDCFANQLFADSVDDITEVLAEAMEHVPLLGEAGAGRFVNGPIPYSPDGAPLCGPAFGLPNFYHACCFPVGITHSAAAGKTLTEWITQGETEWDMSMWDPRRFGEWASFDYTVARACELYEHQYAIPYPHRVWQAARPMQQTPLYQRLLDQGAVFGQVGGWERAFWFAEADQAAEHEDGFYAHNWEASVAKVCESIRDGVGVMDHGGFTRYEVSGPGATDYLNQVFTGTVPAVGRVKLSYMLTPKGKVWSEATIARLSDNDYLLCGPTLADQRDFDWLAKYLPAEGVNLVRGSERYDAALMVMGPESRGLLQSLSSDDMSNEAAPWMSVRQWNIAGEQVLAMRVSYVGELGWELHMSSTSLVNVYTAIMATGKNKGIVNFGSYALNAMRLEKGYQAWGADFGIEYTAQDAGIDRFVNTTKADFVGREGFLQNAQKATDYHFTGFIVSAVEEGITIDPLGSDPILKDGNIVGYVSSAGTGYRIGKQVAMGYLYHAAQVGDDYQVDVLGRRFTMTVASMPFYDSRNERLKS